VLEMVRQGRYFPRIYGPNESIDPEDERSDQIFDAKKIESQHGLFKMVFVAWGTIDQSLFESIVNQMAPTFKYETIEDQPDAFNSLYTWDRTSGNVAP